MAFHILHRAAGCRNITLHSKTYVVLKFIRGVFVTTKRPSRLEVHQQSYLSLEHPNLIDAHSTFAVRSFTSENFSQRLNLPSGWLLGKPLETIVDVRDRWLLKTMLENYVGERGRVGEAAAAVEGAGTTVELRVTCGGATWRSSMSVARGSHGLVVVTRLY